MRKVRWIMDIIARRVTDGILIILGKPCTRKSRQKFSLVVRLLTPVLALHGLSLAIQARAPRLALFARQYWRTGKLVMIVILLNGLRSFPVSRQKVVPLLKIIFSPLIGICLVEESVSLSAFQDTYATLTFLLILSSHLPKRPAQRSLGTSLVLAAIPCLLVGLFVRYGPSTLKPMTDTSSEWFYMSAMLLGCGLLVDDLQTVLGPCAGVTSGVDCNLAPTICLLAETTLCTHIILYSHVGLRTLQQ